MYAKIQITGIVEVKTGMHIGGSSAFAAIGAVDSPVIKDVRTNLPMIPGSSLKGKMRALLAKEYNTKVASKPDGDAPCLLRLFGSAKKDNVKRSRVLVSDMFLQNEEELRRRGLQSLTEVKFENSINRATAVTNPRQIERVIRGSLFDLDIMYEVEEEAEILEDMEILAEGLRLLRYDYLGGNGSRGYGKVLFHDVCADVVVGTVNETIMEQCNALLEKVVG
jgi:CRISPR-associated protein Csm3